MREENKAPVVDYYAPVTNRAVDSPAGGAIGVISLLVGLYPIVAFVRHSDSVLVGVVLTPFGLLTGIAAWMRGGRGLVLGMTGTFLNACVGAAFVWLIFVRGLC